MMLIAAFWKLLRAATHAAHGFWIIKKHFPAFDEAERQARVELWAAQMLDIAGIELVVDGSPPVQGPLLLVANHVSWLDILVIHAARHCRFVSKSDIQQWPFVGTLADGAGTLYVQRDSRRDAHRLVAQMAERLRKGDILAVFPEGTTGDGINLKPFHANLIQAAIDAPAPVQALSLKFVDAATGEVSRAPSYIDDETLMGSIWRTLTAAPLQAVIVFGVPRDPPGLGRREWVEQIRQDIASMRDSVPGPAAH
jgi:1-acyl-sn-glycerol-3-phosphate acyltransferase